MEGRESTFAEDVHDRAEVERTLFELVEQVAYRLRRHGLMGQTVHLKVQDDAPVGAEFTATGTRIFGEKIQPLMKTRQHVVQSLKAAE